jgi:hypothetical protein
MPSKSVILVVVSFLLAALIYSSAARFEAFALHKKGENGCSKLNVVDSGTYMERCCQAEWDEDAAGNILNAKLVCQDCHYLNGENVGCAPPYEVSKNVGPLKPLPPSAGFEQPPSPQPPKNAPLSSTQQTTCPDGSTPDADGKCPPVTQGDRDSKEKEKNPKGPTDTGGAGLAVSDEGAPGKKPVKK